MTALYDPVANNTKDKKLLIFQSTVGNDADALARLSVDDLKFLFL